MKLPLAYYGEPVLRKKCQRVENIDAKIKQLVADMEETMNMHNGIGLAAPQVKVSLALFIINIPEEISEDEFLPGKTRIFINPKITKYSEEEWYRGEGCLSIPEVFGTVSRPMHITIEATDLDGKTFTEDFSGLAARAIMHENDHINGVLFIDRIRGKERQEIDADLREVKKKFFDKKKKK
ncbi:MAG TPA: peptide deformylase [Parachlamydiaceae bacterium]|nr:peptide deformylase [Parachlamydiaceae bacterium]